MISTILAEAAEAVEPAFPVATSLIGTLGPSGAAVLVCWIFVHYLLKRGEADERRDKLFADRYEEHCKQVANRYEEQFRYQAEVIREASAALHDLRHGGTAPRVKP